ncbi:hypothetical protein GOBAR_AA17346 [Gossypium barbadense]|uniref:Kinesin motor domain-containing protein n=1 Tax=Gossypium barbadense TaxID=3634 RepID=A0A2P5XJ12_GOSBA|nr:hypothetical protein GOBAR_AA17346 [Gossypium barbadense]
MAEKICVAVRVRPSISEESPSGTFWKIEDNRISLHKLHGTPISGLSYAFGTAFAYGQTSSGKTYTMNGSLNDPGIIHRAVNDVFQKIQMISDREFLIRVSYMEIYNEEINDLFTVENQKLPIHESLERGIFVAGLREEIVNNAEQVIKLLESGEVNRHFGETNMNARSSRSHTIFRMVIESKGIDTGSGDYSSSDAIRVSILNLVDLAGSERIAKTGAGGVRLKEGKYINKSLMVLGNVINKLSNGAKQRAHIPYRDSKLTRILQTALGGNAKTSIICTVAPEEVHVEETKGTLQFASRAKRITNCAQVNEILTDAALLKRQQLEIEDLRRKLQGSRSEVLEQEILKLRNDMLKDSMKESLKDECNDFKTPCFKETSNNAFVAKRSNYSELPDFSPLPDSFSNVADEDTWFKMNKGYIADLDALQTTPARKVQSFPPQDITPDCSNDNYKLELQNLKTQLELVIKEKVELQRKHEEEVQINSRLMGEICELKQELDLSNNSSESSKQRYGNLETEFQKLKEERDSLLQTVSESSKNITFLTDQKENILKDLNCEVQRRKDLEVEIKQFSVAFASRQRSLASIHEGKSLKDTERDSLLQTVSESSKNITFLTDQKENILKDLNCEVQRRKDLEVEIKQFSVAFASRQRSLASIHGEFKSKIEKLRAENLVRY